MVLLGALPLAHAPQARRAAIIGFGSGLTTHVVLGSPTIEQVDVVEIEPEMVKAARGFQPRVDRAYDDPRSHIHIDDARAWFARSGQQYDFIVSEPSNPWVSGVASLFTPEFYRQANHALAPGGIFVQWFHLYEIGLPQVASIVRALGSVFGDYVLYAANDTDAVLVATATGPVPPLSAALFGWPAMKNELAQVDIRTPAQLQLFRLGNRQGYGPLLEDGEMNTDYHPLLEFGAARSRFFNTEVAALNQLGRDPVPVLDILSGFPGSAPVLGSTIIAAGHPRFGDVLRGNAFAVALTDRSAPLSQLPLQEADVEAATRLRDLARNVDEASWNDWFAALVFASKPMTPNGAAPALATFIRSGDVAVRLAGAPPELRAKVEFLLLVAARDLPRIRTEGIRLLAGPLQAADPAFHAYTLVATVAACLRAPREEGCPATIALLDTVQRRHLVFDLLRAHQRALR